LEGEFILFRLLWISSILSITVCEKGFPFLANLSTIRERKLSFVAEIRIPTHNSMNPTKPIKKPDILEGRLDLGKKRKVKSKRPIRSKNLSNNTVDTE